MTLGELVRYRRGVLGLTQPDLAAHIDRNPSFVSRLENDKLSEIPDPVLLRALADALGTTVLALLEAWGYDIAEGEATRPAGADDPLTLFFAVNSDKMTPEIREALLAIAQADAKRHDGR